MEEKKIISVSEFSANVIIKLTESEARALEALCKYGYDSFLEVFYEKLGSHYLKPHEKGVESLFATLKKEIPQHLRRIDKTRKIWNEK